MERIVDRKVKKGTELFLIKWVGYPESENTWESRENLDGCRALLREFERRNRTSSIADPEFPDKTRRTKQKRKSSNVSIASSSRSSITTGIKPFASNSKTGERSKLDRLLDPAFDRTSEWEFILRNARGPPIVVYNDADDCGPPLDFQYIDHYRYHSKVKLTDYPLAGCSCGGTSGSSKQRQNCLESKCSCIDLMQGQIPYDKNGRLRPNFSASAIYECNANCDCGPDCPLRVIQRGLGFRLQIYRTANNCGWGVRALEPIPKGSFVIAYTGEIITDEEADRRGLLYDFIGRTYLFDIDGEISDGEEDSDSENTPNQSQESFPDVLVDLSGFGRRGISRGSSTPSLISEQTSTGPSESCFHFTPSSGKKRDRASGKLSRRNSSRHDLESEFRLTIDAFHYGNVSRFFNHSCDPNLMVWPCFVETHDPRRHELAFFANRDIDVGEPLSFDYTGGKVLTGSEGITYIECLCGSRNCRSTVTM